MSSDNESEASLPLSSSDDEEMAFHGQYRPYEDEPLADEEFEMDATNDEESDQDGLTPDILAARQDKTVPLESW